jgi:hypothetical protein
MAGQTGVIPKSAEPIVPTSNGSSAPNKGTGKPGGIWPIASGRETPADLEDVIPVNQGRLAKYEVRTRHLLFLFGFSARICYYYISIFCEYWCHGCVVLFHGIVADRETNRQRQIQRGIQVLPFTHLIGPSKKASSQPCLWAFIP